MKKMPSSRRPVFRGHGLAVIGAAATVSVLLAGCSASNESSTPAAGGSAASSDLSGTFSGSGASTQTAAQGAWAAGFQETNPNVTINYDPQGSGTGRKQFIAGGVQFAGTDAYLTDAELASAKTTCGGDVVEVPVYVSPIALVYKLDGVSDLQLAPATVAGIFAGTITTWNDPAIAADNPDATLPATRIAPVHRADTSGTTENFTDYLSKVAPDAWTDEASGDWPIAGGEAAQQTQGVISAVGSGNGTIGYADESQVGDLSVAKVKVGDSYVGPSAEAAAKILEDSTRVEGRGDNSFAYDLKRDTTASGTYPIVLVSYEEACLKYADAATGAVAKAYMTYITSKEGQDAAAKAAGSAPLSDALRTLIEPSIAKIS